MKQSIPSRPGLVLRLVWSRRRWLYASYMLVAVARLTARVGFGLDAPACDARLTAENIALSMTKVPHMVLFGIFFLLTAIQFDRVDRRTILWSLLATLGLGLLVELEEGATRTGNCRITDVLPDLFGAIVAALLLLGSVAILRRFTRKPA